MALRRLLRMFMAPAPDPRHSGRGEPGDASLLSEVRAALDTLADAQDRLGARTGELQVRLDHLESEARQALANGREDLARRSLEQRHSTASELELLERQLLAADRDAERLARAGQQLTARVEAISAQERMLEARRSAAAIQVQVGEALVGISAEIDDCVPELARAEQRAEELEARAAAIDHLLSLGGSWAAERDAFGRPKARSRTSTKVPPTDCESGQPSRSAR
jgi:phage shock protein A